MYQLTFLTTLVLFTTANILTSYLYLYPLAHRCAFPVPPPPLAANDGTPPLAPQGAPFRLLLLGDPQLEGSTSLIDPDYEYFPSLRSLLPALRSASTASLSSKLRLATAHLQEFVQDDLPIVLKSWRKQLDLLGNDFYLAHIYRTLQWFTYPTHTAVLGDLLGSQWIDDAEFEKRGRRFWERVFAGGQKVGEDITNGSQSSPLGVKDVGEEWKRRVINVAGNHDVGYAGDMSFEQVQRFERVFGAVNWETRFTLPRIPGGVAGEGKVPELRLVVLNSLNIDGPAKNIGLQTATFKFLADVAEAAGPVDDATSANILLTHLPLHKKEGVCVDGPMIRYAKEWEGGGIQEQNHLSEESSAGLLDSVFGLSEDGDAPLGGKGSNGIIFTGHDHEGCDVYHHLPSAAEDHEQQRWAAERWNTSSVERYSSEPGIREVTVRSMMGEFGGNAGLLSAWFDVENEKWVFEYESCALGKQHIWWAVHILNIVALVACIYTGGKLIAEALNAERVTDEKKKQ